MPFEALAMFFRRRWPHLESATDPAASRALLRLRIIERDFGLPVKGAILLVLAYYLFLTNWLDDTIHSEREAALSTVRVFFVIYCFLNVGTGVILSGMSRLPLWFSQLVVLCVAIVDVMFVATLTLVTGGFESALYWVFVILMIRNALSIPGAAMQITVNLLVVVCYFMAGLTDISVRKIESRESGLSESVGANEPFFVRLVVLSIMGVCSYGVQVLFEKQRRVEEEAHEFAIRQEQLQATGRLAGEIAHQLKNPLGIINNAAFTLQRTVKEGKTITQQIKIIREEVDRSDRIITDLMGFARLAEGTVEPLALPENLDKAIEQVFPVAVDFEVEIHRKYSPALPRIYMQRGHLSEILVNLLQNAREAMEGRGEIYVEALSGEGYSVLITIRDTGPGIPEDQLGPIFEPYYTTKEKGTGLGLAIVRHNVEIYGGQLWLESEVGKGTKFYLQFPARTLMKLRK